jgi:hypothetical protein
MYGLKVFNPKCRITLRDITLVEAMESTIQLCKNKSPTINDMKKDWFFIFFLLLCILWRIIWNIHPHPKNYLLDSLVQVPKPL